MRVSNKEKRINRHDTVRLVRDVLGFRSIRVAEEFLENLDILIEYLSDYLELEEGKNVTTMDLGEYLTVEKRRSKAIKNWRMPDGRFIDREEKIRFNVKFRGKGRNLHNVQF